MSPEPPGHPEPPAPRSRSGTIGRHSARTGSEPVTARSPLRLRLLLSGIFLPVFVAAAALFALWARASGPGGSPHRAVLITIAALCAIIAFLAVVDLLVVVRRLRRERGTGR
ncbi:DUF6343 family protein [Streptomyces sp. NPDC001508]|uniref:DUF6343 family protein n=1 Tax=Streptomyces sp. NPDC001508 TaxID=3154656 RepID=UPI0033279D30